MKKILITSLTCLISTVAFADQDVVVPTLEGGLTASIGTFYAATGAGDYNYANHVTLSNGSAPFVTTPAFNSPDYDFGWEASLGYVFEETANGIELTYRGLHSTTADSISAFGNTNDYIAIPGMGDHNYSNANNELKYDFDTVDLMISQFVNFGDYVQMRFSGGLAYVFIKQTSQTDFIGESNETVQNSKSKFQGLGPRIASDGRYDFGDGFGIVGGASLAYLMGKIESYNQAFDITANAESWNYEENINNHAVLNVRANLGVDYVFFFNNDEGSTLGLELGYLADYYVEALNEVNGGGEASTYGPSSAFQSASFAGPYVNLKGVF
jgi:hypothetical protein